MSGEAGFEEQDREDVVRRPARPRNRPAQGSGAEPVPIGIDSTGTAPDPIFGQRPVQAMASLPPEILPRLVSTQAAYKQLVSSGLSAAEAAGLIGFVSGLAPNTTPWTMSQVNRMLFLRSLYRDGEWGRQERQAAS